MGRRADLILDPKWRLYFFSIIPLIYFRQFLTDQKEVYGADFLEIYPILHRVFLKLPNRMFLGDFNTTCIRAETHTRGGGMVGPPPDGIRFRACIPIAQESEIYGPLVAIPYRAK